MIVYLKLVIQFSFEIISLVIRKWLAGEVQDKSGPVSLCVKLQDGRMHRCHVDQVVSVPLVSEVADSSVVTVPIASEQVMMEPIQESSGVGYIVVYMSVVFYFDVSGEKCSDHAFLWLCFVSCIV